MPPFPVKTTGTQNTRKGRLYAGKEKERPPAGSPYRASQRYEMGEEGRQDANADSPLPRFPVFVSCNPGNSVRVAIEDAALKGRR